MSIITVSLSKAAKVAVDHKYKEGRKEVSAKTHRRNRDIHHAMHQSFAKLWDDYKAKGDHVAAANFDKSAKKHAHKAHLHQKAVDAMDKAKKAHD